MPETTIPSATTSPATTLTLDPQELALLIASLRLMRSILGRDEADELAAVERLLDRLTPRPA